MVGVGGNEQEQQDKSPAARWERRRLGPVVAEDAFPQILFYWKEQKIIEPQWNVTEIECIFVTH